MLEVLLKNPKLLIILLLAFSILGSFLIYGLVKLFKKLKINQFKIAGLGVEIEGEPKKSEEKQKESSPIKDNNNINNNNNNTQITIPFENFNAMVKHCVKVAIEAAQYKSTSEGQTLAQQNKCAQELLEEVMEKVNRTFHEKKVKEGIEKGALNPHSDIAIVYFEEDFEDDFKSIVYPRLDQFLSDERLAFTDEIDLANMCETLKRQISFAIEDKLNRGKYAENRELAQESFNSCKQALSDALDDSLHKAKLISITNYEDVKKATAKKDEDLNTLVQAYTNKEVKNDFISKEILEGN